MDMRFYWARDRVKQKHFNVLWKPGVINIGDYFTKHHPPEHHKGTRTVYLHCTNIDQDSAKKFYSKCTSNMTQGKIMPTRGYNDTVA